MSSVKPIFSKGTPPGTRFVALSLLAVVLLIVDVNTQLLRPVRSSAGMVLTPLYWLGDLPLRWGENMRQMLTGRMELIDENERLRAENLLTKRRLQKMALLVEQNIRLRELLNSSEQLEERVLVAELLGVDPGSNQHRLLVNKGSSDGVYVGQPVLDALGVMGQVTEVMPYSARIVLITDQSHSIPVQVTRNGLRAIASGTGNQGQLELRHVGALADIREGDLLISSGMGQKFPVGYPVAVVSKIERGHGQPFAAVEAVPAAALSRSRYFLLVFAEQHQDVVQDLPVQPTETAATVMEAEDGD